MKSIVFHCLICLMIMPAFFVTVPTRLMAMTPQSTVSAATNTEPALPENMEAFYDVPYVSDAEKNQKLDIYIPTNVKNPALVVMIHGGQYLFGDKKDEPVSLFLNAGFAVASINYRLSWEALFPA